MKEETRKTIYQSLFKHICALVLAIWLVFLVLLTWAVAQDFQKQIDTSARYMMTGRLRAIYLSDIPEDTPGYPTLRLIEHLEDPYRWVYSSQLLPFILPQHPRSLSSDSWLYGKWDLLYGFQAATVFFDEAGEPVMESGNLMTICCIPEEDWKAQKTDYTSVAYIDLDKLSQGQDFLKGLLWSSPEFTRPNTLFSCVFRITGYFEGDELIPMTLDTTWDLVSNQDSLEVLCRSDNRGLVDWENKLTQEVPDDRELVTVYVREIGGITFEDKPAKWREWAYDSLTDMARDTEFYAYSDSLIESIITYGGYATEDVGNYTVRMVVRSWPLGYALLRLIPTYLIGTLIIALCLWRLRRYLHNNLIYPLTYQAKSIQDGRPVIPCSSWQEVRQAEEDLKQLQSQLRIHQNDSQQLRSALDYARNAEETRRQLVSNITHELKTPLAVIHSYAEGLQAGIAEEKKERYLSTILEETEKMDGMVLEMLDLSRLEAGKVRLSADYFSLLALTQEIVNKLAPEESREQEISFAFCNDCFLTADEGRISQVVTNLVSNALRYTPKDGAIWLRVFSDKDNAYFQIENTAPHLSEEALERIFDTFYRASTSRSDKGTGLGLPIARNIVQLHRGTLTAKNTWVGGRACLEFAFRIPLR